MDEGYNHEANSTFDAVGVTEEDLKSAAKGVLKFAMESDKISEVIEKMDDLCAANDLFRKCLLMVVYRSIQEFICRSMSKEEVMALTGVDTSLEKPVSRM